MKTINYVRNHAFKADYARFVGAPQGRAADERAAAHPRTLQRGRPRVKSTGHASHIKRLRLKSPGRRGSRAPCLLVPFSMYGVVQMPVGAISIIGHAPRIPYRQQA